MSSTLKLCLVQYNPKWENIAQNLNNLSTLLHGNIANLLILPEMFATGFSMNTQKIAQTEEGSILNWMKTFSLQQHIAICGSVAIVEHEQYYNEFFFVSEGKILAQYRKRHLFTYGKEEKYFATGTEKILFQYKGWKICPMICYDLRFPVWNRNTEDYDILLNVANWPITRIENWKILHQARAIENQCFSVGCNRTGIDGNQLQYNGNSIIVSPSGKIVEPNEVNDELLYFTLHQEELLKIRSTFPFLADRDAFTILTNKNSVVL